jgi:hypothetical protein
MPIPSLIPHLRLGKTTAAYLLELEGAIGADPFRAQMP